MSQAENPYRSPYGAMWGEIAARAEPDARAGFIRKTYSHLLAAVMGFAALETLLLSTVADQMVPWMIGGRWSWLIVLGAFMGVSWIADAWARSETSPAMQYLGLVLYVVAEAVIFMPLLWIANSAFPGHNIVPTAGLITVILFSAMTGIVFLTRHDFSWLGTTLWIAGLAAFGIIVCSMIFGFSLGILFTGLMILFACGWILYDTSNILHHYRVGQDVAAALALFASVALLFWYVIQLVMRYWSND